MSVDVNQGDKEGLDRSHRYLRPVAEYDSDAVHLSVYAWLPMFEAWATGMSLCGGSMRQGPLPAEAKVTCAACAEWKPKYERMLAPGYDPADDDPDMLRARAERAEAALTRVLKLAYDVDDPSWRAPGSEVALRIRSAVAGEPEGGG